MKFRNLRYYLSEASKSIVRNKLMSVASIVTVACCIFILAISYCIITNIDFILKNVEDEMNLSAYILDSIDDEAIDGIEEKILAIDHVVGTEFTSSAEAMADFSSEYIENQDFTIGLDEEGANILPRSFDIMVDNIIYQEQVKAELDKMVGTEFEKVHYNKESVDALMGISNIIRIVSILIIALLSLVSVIIIMNTIKLTVTNRQNEINIMKYVGATDWFIRWPFIIEGMLIGFIGALVPTVICMVSYGKAISSIDEIMPAITTLFEFKTTYSVFVILVPFSFFLGIFIGAVGSVTSVRKHLQV